MNYCTLKPQNQFMMYKVQIIYMSCHSINNTLYNIYLVAFKFLCMVIGINSATQECSRFHNIMNAQVPRASVHKVATKNFKVADSRACVNYARET